MARRSQALIKHYSAVRITRIRTHSVRRSQSPRLRANAYANPRIGAQARGKFAARERPLDISSQANDPVGVSETFYPLTPMNTPQPFPEREFTANRLFVRLNDVLQQLLRSEEFLATYGSIKGLHRWLITNIPVTDNGKAAFHVGAEKVYHNIFNPTYPCDRFQYRFYYFIALAMKVPPARLFARTAADKPIRIADVIERAAADATSQTATRMEPDTSAIDRGDSDTPSSHDDVFNRIKASRLLTVGVFDNDPIVSIGTDGELQGLYGELIKIIARKYSLKIKAVRVRNRRALQKVASRECDIVLGLFQTSLRARDADFCALLYAGVIAAVTLSPELRLRSLSELAASEAKIAVGCDEAAATLIEHGLGLSSDRFIGTDSSFAGDVMRALENGSADLAISDGIACANYVELKARQFPGLRLLFDRCPLSIAHYAVMTPKGQPVFTEWLDQECRLACQNEAFQRLDSEILRKYPRLIIKG